MYALYENTNELRYTAREKAAILGSKLLPSTILSYTQSIFTEVSGKTLKENVVNGQLVDNKTGRTKATYNISWLCLPEKAYASDSVFIILRKDSLGLLPNYALIDIGESK